MPPTDKPIVSSKTGSKKSKKCGSAVHTTTKLKKRKSKTRTRWKPKIQKSDVVPMASPTKSPEIRKEKQFRISNKPSNFKRIKSGESDDSKGMLEARYPIEFAKKSISCDSQATFQANSLAPFTHDSPEKEFQPIIPHYSPYKNDLIFKTISNKSKIDTPGDLVCVGSNSQVIKPRYLQKPTIHKQNNSWNGINENTLFTTENNCKREEFTQNQMAKIKSEESSLKKPVVLMKKNSNMQEIMNQTSGSEVAVGSYSPQKQTPTLLRNNQQYKNPIYKCEFANFTNKMCELATWMQEQTVETWAGASRIYDIYHQLKWQKQEQYDCYWNFIVFA